MVYCYDDTMFTTTAQSHSTTDVATNPSYVDQYAPPTASSAPAQQPQPAQPFTITPPPAPAVESKPAASASELLEDQNIFFLLGVMDGTEEQREKFLDELQQVIWEDFLEYDVRLLITQDENTELEKIIAETGVSELEKQEKIVVYLEKLVPDLEEIMLDKALELKADLFKERIGGVREFYSDKPEQLEKVGAAEAAMQADKWRTAAEMLNTIV